jgi:pyruvoyl-dependent arginine decarboxylase (PvlArgDC)
MRTYFTAITVLNPDPSGADGYVMKSEIHEFEAPNDADELIEQSCKFMIEKKYPNNIRYSIAVAYANPNVLKMLEPSLN